MTVTRIVALTATPYAAESPAESRKSSTTTRTPAASAQLAAGT